MRRLRITMSCLLLLAAGGLPADEPSRPAPSVGADLLAPSPAAREEAAVPLPLQTPFENDPERRNSYRRGYLAGYRRARMPEGEPARMTEPEVSNPAAVRGFVEGWQAGVASLPAGSVPGSLPRSFAGTAPARWTEPREPCSAGWWRGSTRSKCSPRESFPRRPGTRSGRPGSKPTRRGPPANLSAHGR